MNILIQAIKSCFITDNIISVENLDTIKEETNIPNYKLESETTISVNNLNTYTEKLVEVKAENNYYLFDIFNIPILNILGLDQE